MAEKLPSSLIQAPQRRQISAGRDWRLAEYICDAGPEDHAFEERHEGVLVAAVLSGTFSYHGDAGRGILVPGSLMLGNHGSCYACGHEHSRGDRCLALHIAPALFEEMTSSIGGSSRYRFGMTHLPPHDGLLTQIVKLETLAREDRLALDEAMPLLIESLLRTVCGARVKAQRISSADHRRVARAP